MAIYFVTNARCKVQLVSNIVPYYQTLIQPIPYVDSLKVVKRMTKQFHYFHKEPTVEIISMSKLL